MIPPNYRQTDNHYSAAERQLRDAAPTSTAAASKVSAPQSQAKNSRNVFHIPAIFFFFPSLNASRATDIMGRDVSSASNLQYAGILKKKQKKNTADKRSAACGAACRAR